MLCDPSHLIRVSSPVADWRLDVQVMWLYSTDRQTYACAHFNRTTPTPGETNIEYLTMMGGTLVGVKSETVMEYVITRLGVLEWRDYFSVYIKAWSQVSYMYCEQCIQP